MGEVYTKMDTPDLFLGATAKELFAFVCGNTVGSGCFREVFNYNLKKGYVIKVEQQGSCFENAFEWEIWNKVKGTPLAKWFAPCLDISHSGTWLVQAKTKPLTKAQLPDKMPSFFKDIKRANMGMYKGHPCVHDYGVQSIKLERGLTSRMRKIDWTDHDYTE